MKTKIARDRTTDSNCTRRYHQKPTDGMAGVVRENKSCRDCKDDGEQAVTHTIDKRRSTAEC